MYIGMFHLIIVTAVIVLLSDTSPTHTKALLRWLKQISPLVRIAFYLDHPFLKYDLIFVVTSLKSDTNSVSCFRWVLWHRGTLLLVDSWWKKYFPVTALEPYSNTTDNPLRNQFCLEFHVYSKLSTISTYCMTLFTFCSLLYSFGLPEEYPIVPVWYKQKMTFPTRNSINTDHSL